MSEVSTFRLYLLRAMYLFVAVGLAIEKLPALLHPANLSPGDSVKIVLFPAKIDPKSGAGHSLIFTVSRIGAGDEERRIGMVIEVFAKRRSARWAV